MEERLPITTRTDFTSSASRKPARDSKEVGRRGVASARAALTEARQRALAEEVDRAARREAELLSGRDRRRSTSRAA